MGCYGQSFTGTTRLVLLVAVVSYDGMVTCEETTPGTCPRHCICDFQQFVANCSGVGLFDVTELADGPFDWTESLDCSDNHFSEVTRETFFGFPGLLDLSLATNRIREITNGSFSLLSGRLHRLILGGNLLADVPSAIRELRALRELDLSQNDLWFIGADSFAGLDMLESLNLDQNSLHEFDGQAFHGLVSLQKLSMTENFLAVDPVGWFTDCPMRELYLSHNAIPLSIEVQSWFGPNDTAPLEYLVLVNNGIDLLSPGRFRGLVNLQKLDLGRNQIKTITEESMEGLFNINELTINANSLAFIDEKSFWGMFDLHTLSIDENKLVSLPRGLFSQSKRLARLNVARNNLVDISAITDEYLPELAELYIFSNSIQEIASHGFTMLPMLSQLVAGGNLLTAFPNVTNLPELQVLELSQNEISFVSRTAFDGSPSLVEIYLQRNKLEWLQYDTFDGLFYLEKLALSHNLWWCDCRIEWMQALMYEEVPPLWVDDIIEDVYCENPPELRLMPLVELTQQDLVLRCPNLPNRNIILTLLGTWFGLVLIFLLRFWFRKLSRANKRKKVTRRNSKYHNRHLKGKGRSGLFGHRLWDHCVFKRSESHALILQKKDTDEQDGGHVINGNGDIFHGEKIEIARVTTV